MGFDKTGESNFKIPVSDSQAYRQFGNSVVVPVIEEIAKLMSENIIGEFNLNKKDNFQICA